jgi:hypothetical protein
VNYVSHTVVENLKQFAFEGDKSRMVRRTFWLIKVVSTWKRFEKRCSNLYNHRSWRHRVSVLLTNAYFWAVRGGLRTSALTTLPRIPYKVRYCALSSANSAACGVSALQFVQPGNRTKMSWHKIPQYMNPNEYQWIQIEELGAPGTRTATLSSHQFGTSRSVYFGKWAGGGVPSPS